MTVWEEDFDSLSDLHECESRHRQGKHACSLVVHVTYEQMLKNNYPSQIKTSKIKTHTQSET